MQKTFDICVAATNKNGIGFQGKLPWPHLRSDLDYFKQLTQPELNSECSKQNVVIMGRKTYESLPIKPLPKRINIVVSTTMTPGCDGSFFAVPSFNAAFDVIDASFKSVGDIFCIGGSKIYSEALDSKRCRHIYLTRILKEYSCDTFLPHIDYRNYSIVDVGDVQFEKSIPFQFIKYTRNPYTEEQNYLDLVNDVINKGITTMDRTMVGTKFLFGKDLRFRLQKGDKRIMPLYTTKRVFFRAVVAELLFFLSGSTDVTVLSKQGIHIWDGNTSRTALDKLGFTTRKVGDMGPGYSFQWRHWGAKYIDADTDYKGQGIDQITQLIQKIKTNPSDRRMIVTSYNVSDLPLMALPPCHYSMEFCVDLLNQELSCKVNIRSNDLGLGNPINCSQYALLVHMISSVTGYKAGELIISIGNAHVYLNHIEQLQEQIKRTPTEFPTVEIDETIKDIDSFTHQHIKLVGYNPQGALKMEMAV